MKVSLTPVTRAPAAAPGVAFLSAEPAVVVGGTAGFAEPIAPSASSLFGPRGAAIDADSGALVVADTGHHRLSIWRRCPDADGVAADVLIGQPDWLAEGRNGRGEPGPATLNVPTGVAFADGGALIVADAWNHRVLIWRQLPTEHNQPADLVLGQADLASVDANRGRRAPGADTLNWCYGVTWADGRLFVADTGNRRVLVWDGLPERDGQPADRVLGQRGFALRDENAGEDAGPLGMRWPHGVARIGDRVLVADAGNNRIMVWHGLPDAPGAACDFVIGQATVAELEHNRTRYYPDERCLNMPYGLAVTDDGWLVTADTANSRLVAHRAEDLRPDAPATGLAGQPDFGAKGDNRWKAVARDSLCWPYGVSVAGDRLVVADSGNNRVLVWPLAVVHTEIRVRGVVQGVGFRPSVYRLAQEERLTGDVSNDGDGVRIRASGTVARLRRFEARLRAEPPPLAQIDEVTVCEAAPTGLVGFRIAASAGGPARTAVSPDAAACPACLAEVASAFERRFRYPFTNCTHCGPRFTIVERIPYDRANTTMSAFGLCDDCAREYADPNDRRYHAQPVACHRCGPRVRLFRFDGRATSFDRYSQLDDVDAVGGLLLRGELVAIKGLGGYHLACDATNADAVGRLRAAKRRYAKPFALMARDLDVIRRYARVSEAEAELLTSSEAPIVLLDAEGIALPPAVAPGVGTLGFMLPYTPLHALILRRLDRPAVMTSGNLCDEPQVIDDDVAARVLAPLAAFALGHDRPIANRVDDSVVRVVAGEARLLRRARGYAPRPMPLPPGFERAPPVLAFGGHVKSTFCLVRDGAAVVSQHQGDLGDPATVDDYEKNLALYAELFDHRPELLAADLHPEYVSTRLARDRAASTRLPLVGVQHHHAHIASVLAERGVPLDAAPVMGVVLDGLGWGDGGELWGGEFLLADYRASERLGTLKPVALLGGEQAMREPWRNLYAHLMAELGWPRFAMNFDGLELHAFVRDLPRDDLDAVLRSGAASPKASSCGRLFDAVAAALGLCRDRAAYEGHAAVLLEAAIDRDALGEDEELAYPFAIPRLPSGLAYVEPVAMWQALLGDLVLATPPGVIAARFHRGLARIVAAMVSKVCQGRFDTVALTGGCFQNRALLELTVARLRSAGFTVLTNARVPSNDGGISLGQAAIAAARAMGRA